MSQLPYWFTNEDKANPVHCRACKQHIPKAIYSAGRGLCPNCLSRVSSRPGGTTETMPSTAHIPTPAYTVPAVTTPAPLAKVGPPSKRAAISAPTIAVLILVAGFAIGAVRLWMHV